MNTLLFEWTKTRSVSTTWTLAIGTIVSSLGLSLIGASGQTASITSSLLNWDPTAASLKGILFAQLVIGMLGALSITKEYEHKTIDASLSVVPSRTRFLSGKIVVLLIVSLFVSVFTVFTNFFAVQLYFQFTGIENATIAVSGVAKALFAAVLYLTSISVLGLALGVLTRSTAASLAVLVVITLLVPAIGAGLPEPIGFAIKHYWPTTAGQAAYAVVRVTGSIGVFWSMLVAYSTVTLTVIAGFLAFQHRDI